MVSVFCSNALLAGGVIDISASMLSRHGVETIRKHITKPIYRRHHPVHDKLDLSPNLESILDHYGAPLLSTVFSVASSFLLLSSTKEALKESWRHGAVL